MRAEQAKDVWWRRHSSTWSLKETELNPKPLLPVRLEAIEISGALTSASVPLRGGGCTKEGGREAWGRGEGRAGYGDSSSCSRSGSSSSSECGRECAPGAENAPPVRQADSESEAHAAPRLDHDGAPAARGGERGQEQRAPASLPTRNEKLLAVVARHMLAPGTPPCLRKPQPMAEAEGMAAAAA